MIRKYALIKNNIVESIQEIDLDIDSLTGIFDLFIDITDMTPQPQLNWVLNGNKLEFPQGLSDRETLELILTERKVDFGVILARTSIIKIGARNKILNKNGAQVTAILTQLAGVKALLETGALGTARYSCSLLKVVYTEYEDIFQHVMSEVDRFEAEYGL